MRLSRDGLTSATAALACALLLGGCGGAGGSEADGGTVSGTASEDDKTLQAAWGVSMWVEDKKELVVGFLPGRPNAEELERILKNQSLFMGASLRVPLVQFSIRFADSDGEPDPLSPKTYSLLWDNFSKMPMTLQRSPSSGGVIQISGDLRPGGTVRGRFQGTDKWEMGDKRRSYRWALNFELVVR